MEDESRKTFESVLAFAKQNLFSVLIGVLGLVFLSIGAVQFLAQKEAQITFEKGETIEAEKKPAQKILVDVQGAVVKPGVYSLSAESRIKDAILSAGGFSNEADQESISKQINLAQKISDAAKIYIPKKGDQVVLGTSGSSGVSTININTASFEQLESLPGVGKVTAQKIIDGRPYTAVEDLVEKKIVGKSVFEKIKDKITVY